MLIIWLLCRSVYDFIELSTISCFCKKNRHCNVELTILMTMLRYCILVRYTTSYVKVCNIKTPTTSNITSSIAMYHIRCFYITYDISSYIANGIVCSGIRYRTTYDIEECNIGGHVTTVSLHISYNSFIPENIITKIILNFRKFITGSNILKLRNWKNVQSTFTRKVSWEVVVW